MLVCLSACLLDQISDCPNTLLSDCLFFRDAQSRNLKLLKKLKLKVHVSLRAAVLKIWK